MNTIPLYPDAKLDGLLRRVSACMEGEHLLDVATVCADMAVYAIHKQFEDQPEEAHEALEYLLEAMRAALARDRAGGMQ